MALKLETSRLFDKQYARLPARLQRRADRALVIFSRNPLDERLRNHSLTGQLNKYRSISAGGDLRLHYYQSDQDTVRFVAIGTHSQLYK